MSKKQIKPLSDFEETCMWMSYRYAIGRHSIASVMHAKDIAVNCFYRLSNEQKEFTSYDISKCIYEQLCFPFNFYIDGYYRNENKNFQPLEKFLDFISFYEIKDLDKLLDYERITLTQNGYECKMYGDGDRRVRTVNVWDIGDLISWQKLAAAFDVKNLKVIYVQGEDEQVTEYFCFRSYYKTYARKLEKDLQGNEYYVNDLHDVTYVPCWVSVEDYVNGLDNRYLIDDRIIKIRDITEEECKQFDCKK